VLKFAKAATTCICPS